MKVIINREVGGFQVPSNVIGRMIEKVGYEKVKSIVYRETYRDREAYMKTLNYGNKEIKRTIHEEYYVDAMEEYIYELNYEKIFKLELRTNPYLINILESLVEKPRGLVIIEIPDDVKFEIVESPMGIEHIAEIHRKWY